MNETWHVLSCRSNRTLHAHEQVDKYVHSVFTPFEVKFRGLTRLDRKNGVKRRPEAKPCFGGYLFFSLTEESDLSGLLHLINHRSYLHRIYMSKSSVGQMYHLPKDFMDWMADWGRGYDRKKDSRKNLQRIYGEKALPDRPPAPIFEIGESVEFLSGGMQGIKATMKGGKGEIAEIETMIFGSVRTIKASVFDLKKAG